MRALKLFLTGLILAVFLSGPVGAWDNTIETLNENGVSIVSRNVGIGSTDPQSALDVVGNFIVTGDGTITGALSTGSLTTTGAFNAGSLSLATSGASTFSGGDVYITNGNLGIGTTVPTQKIDVVGTVKATAFTGDGSGLTGVSGGGSGLSGLHTGAYVVASGATTGIDGAIYGSGGNVYISSGTFSIGTTAPRGIEKLAVDGNIYVMSGGNVGIGTTVPLNALSVGSLTAASQIQLARGVVIGTTGTYGLLLENTTASSATSGAGIMLVGNDGAAFIAGDRAGKVLWAGSISATSIRSMASIASVAEGTLQATNSPGALIFETTTGGTSTPTEKMRVTNAGNVGIGTTVPRAGLEVGGAGTINSSAISAISDVHINGDLEVDGSLYVDGWIYARNGVVTGSF